MMVLHALWLPETGEPFIQSGELRLWVERELSAPDRGVAAGVHPFQPEASEWPVLLEGLGLQRRTAPVQAPIPCDIRLPSIGGTPLASPELARRLPELPDTGGAALETWQVDTIPLPAPIRQLAEIQFLALHQGDALALGQDLRFWAWLTQGLKRLVLRDQYLPAPRLRQPPKRKGRRKTPPAELYLGWDWAPGPLDQLVAEARDCMPPACAAALPELAEPQSLIRHCAEVLLDDLVVGTKRPAVLQRRIDGTPLAFALRPPDARAPCETGTAAADAWRQWQGWRQQLGTVGHDETLQLGFRLVEPTPDGNDEDWRLEFLAIAADDPSHRVPLADYWAAGASGRARHRKRLGADLERRVLLDLGLAARMVPMLWDGLDTAEPQSVRLDLDGAFAFLKEAAWVLEDAGFKVIVPAWWTPKGRRRVKLRLRTGTRRGTSAGSSPGSGALSLDNLIKYRYQLAIGEEAVSEAEWQQLIEAKSPLVRFRGQWVELDRERMQEMLAFWREHGDEQAEIGIQEVLARTAEDDGFEVDRDDALAEMLERLADHDRLEPAATPPGLKADLRPYQRRGLAWLGYLERLGLNGCLADDMGLGKTMQVIALLLAERAEAGTGRLPPTLLIVPTSVIGNWRKEVERFAPGLSVHIHHGPKREQAAKAFKALAAGHDIVISSYALARKDEKLLAGVRWRRLVLDEAQNIKNPKAAQTRAVNKIPAERRLALTGTPVENRLTDLWSIFQFANPGYLGTAAQFRKRFELPVQRDHDPVQTETLKRLVQPFILRRVKTDKSIIADLPEKLEAVQYCNLSREQAALYEGVVRDVEQQLEEKDGIERQGLMLSTLMRLKQICNHPAQFLADASAFTPERSHKLERLLAMLEETRADGDSVLVFTQFTDIGEQLERLLRRESGYRTYYLHGGTSRTKREQMIDAFQDGDGEPAAFVLSLKAGGVGITLTRANQVFHFDRWWNPAVEDQASDRAYRIGQQKTVFVHKFVTIGTLEERIHAMIEEKKALAGAIVGSDESWLAQLDNDRFRALIRLERTAVMA